MRPWNPDNPFHSVRVEHDDPLPARLVLRDDDSRSILVENRSPDIPFRWSLNPYRGCTHACAYCYARRTHEYLDLGAGTDFERVLFVKRRAPALLEEALAAPRWVGEPVNASGVTDLYQPIEARLRIARGCLEVLADHRQPVSLITRSPLILRDLDLLRALAAHGAVRVQVSIPLLDADACRALEPGTRPPRARLAAIRTLADAGIPVGVSLAPVIPGLSDSTLPATLEAAAQAGARWAWMSALRLPGSVADVFARRLRAAFPDRAEAVLDRVRRGRGGRLDDARFGHRMRRQDPAWAITEQAFQTWCRRTGLDARSATPFPEPSPFRRPIRRRHRPSAEGRTGGQLGLFDPPPWRPA